MTELPWGSPSSPESEKERIGALVRHHRAADPRESLSKDIMLAELARLDDPFDRTADLTHITASAVVVGDLSLIHI